MIVVVVANRLKLVAITLFYHVSRELLQVLHFHKLPYQLLCYQLQCRQLHPLPLDGCPDANNLHCLQANRLQVELLANSVAKERVRLLQVRNCLRNCLQPIDVDVPAAAVDLWPCDADCNCDVVVVVADGVDAAVAVVVADYDDDLRIVNDEGYCEPDIVAMSCRLQLQ